MSELFTKKFEIEFVSSKSLDGELFAAFIALIDEFDVRLAPGNFDPAAVARCARHILEMFEPLEDG